MSSLPPDYIVEWIQGEDRKLLEIYYTAERSEGGSADEVILRGLKAVLAHASQQVEIHYQGQLYRMWPGGKVVIKDDANAPTSISAKLAVAPVSVSVKPWEREGWCDADGKCWFGAPQIGSLRSMWVLGSPGELATYRTHSLPHWGIPLIKDDQP